MLPRVRFQLPGISGAKGSPLSDDAIRGGKESCHRQAAQQRQEPQIRQGCSRIQRSGHPRGRFREQATGRDRYSAQGCTNPKSCDHSGANRSRLNGNERRSSRGYSASHATDTAGATADAGNFNRGCGRQVRQPRGRSCNLPAMDQFTSRTQGKERNSRGKGRICKRPHAFSATLVIRSAASGSTGSGASS